MMTLISAVVIVILTVMGARACTASSPDSPSNPINVARNGFAGLCANAQATAAAGGASPGDPSVTLVSPSDVQQLQAGDPGGLAAVQKAVGGSLLCPTTTTAP
jgi:hypothetical protein